MKKLLFIAALVLALNPTRVSAQPSEYEVDLSNMTNVAHYAFYIEGVSPEQRVDLPGDMYFHRDGEWVEVCGKVDMQAITANATMKAYMTLPYAPNFHKYWEASGTGSNPGGKPPISVSAATTGTDGFNDKIILTTVPTTTDMRAFSLCLKYIIRLN